MRKGAEERIHDMTRLKKHQFEALLQWLESNTGFKDSRFMGADEKLALFLFVVGHNASMRQCRELFGRSTRTCSRSFHDVQRRVRYNLYKEYVKPPSIEASTFIEEAQSGRFWPYFSGAIGAADGTHLKISVPNGVGGNGQIPWRNRKGYVSQNVLGVIDFEMNFTYVLAEFEGSAHDYGVFTTAITKSLKIPNPYYVLVDAGYSPFNGRCLPPFKKVRYHLQEWQRSERAGNPPSNAKELFNHRHSSLRYVVERTFGVLKARFHTLDKYRKGFSIPTQVQIVYGCVALHNFLNAHGSDPATYLSAEDEESIATMEAEDPELLERYEPDERMMEERRLEIARTMYRDYKMSLVNDEKAKIASQSRTQPQVTTS
jgi:hypothetical protein